MFLTVAEVQASAKALAAQLTLLIQTFEKETGCIIHSLPVRPASGGVEAMVDVKVQIP